MLESTPPDKKDETGISDSKCNLTDFEIFSLSVLDVDNRL